MAKYRHKLPLLDGGLYLTDGGIETTLIFHEGWTLPIGEAFVLLTTQRGRAALKEYFDRYVPLAIENGTGFLLESPTWRANPDWAEKVGYEKDALARINAAAIGLLEEVRQTYESEACRMPISGCIGPRGDGYAPGRIMTAQEAEDYHAWQVGVFAVTNADLVSAITMTSGAEGLGVAMAAKKAHMPSVISFTVETDGRLPSGETLADAIAKVDDVSGGAPAYYMINCAHPTHFAPALEEDAAWVKRIRGLRANASRKSHQELDNSPELDIGDPMELGGEYAQLMKRMPHLAVLGGCCGTDHRHVAQIGMACRRVG